MMKILSKILFASTAAILSINAQPQFMDKDVPLMRPDEEEVVGRQSKAFSKLVEPILSEAAESTVRIWVQGDRRQGGFRAYGTVIGDGTQVLTKWSEVARYRNSLQVQTEGARVFPATVEGVFTEEDLAILKLGPGIRMSRNGIPEEVPGQLIPVKFHQSNLQLGRMLLAPQPTGRLAASGITGVLERNLRETDQAHLGILVDPEYTGDGLRIQNVQPGYGAAEAGLQEGDIILKIDESSITGMQRLKNVLSKLQPGDVVKMLIESAGAERDVEVTLSNRPLVGQFAGGRLNQMEIMGGPINEIRGGFSRVVQSDMKIKKNQVGGPVVDLSGKVIGITMARADRTRTYIMGSEALMDLLKTKYDTLEEALAKNAERQMQLAQQRENLLRQQRSMRRGPSLGQMRRKTEDLGRLNQLLRDELNALGRP